MSRELRLKYIWHVAGAHAHVAVFAKLVERDEVGTFGKCGDLCFRADEWAAFREQNAMQDYISFQEQP